MIHYKQELSADQQTNLQPMITDLPTFITPDRLLQPTGFWSNLCRTSIHRFACNHYAPRNARNGNNTPKFFVFCMLDSIVCHYLPYEIFFIEITTKSLHRRLLDDIFEPRNDYVIITIFFFFWNSGCLQLLLIQKILRQLNKVRKSNLDIQIAWWYLWTWKSLCNHYIFFPGCQQFFADTESPLF